MTRPPVSERVAWPVTLRAIVEASKKRLARDLEDIHGYSYPTREFARAYLQSLENGEPLVCMQFLSVLSPLMDAGWLVSRIMEAKSMMQDGNLFHKSWNGKPLALFVRALNRAAGFDDVC